MAPWFNAFFRNEQSQRISDVCLRISLVVFTCRFCIQLMFKFVFCLLNYEHILLTVLLAAIIPKLESIISLVGAVSSSTLALIFPPLIEMITFWPNNQGQRFWVLWKDIAIMCFGILGFVFGSYSSIAELLKPDSK